MWNRKSTYKFRHHFIFAFLFANMFLFCQKQYTNEEYDRLQSGFTDYFIPKGQNYSTDSTDIVRVGAVNEMKFQFKFDNTAIYTTADPTNQGDVNKLYGFADCVSFTTLYTIAPHHIHSARFGWAWQNQALHIYAYYYTDSVRHFKDLRTVEIGRAYSAGIKLVPNGYEFTLDNKKDTFPRTCTSTTISGYKLYPFFGGTEPAPHDVHIGIKEEL
ncbi:MAG: hypothetical protein V4539_19195 [Bacteroidota bacterium]